METIYSVKVPVVGLGCAPHKFLFCSQEYTEDQLLNSTCICHPLYSQASEVTLATSGIYNKNNACFPKAGVPCKFNTTNDFGDLLPKIALTCGANMKCEDISDTSNNWKLFEKGFAGFGMSPIARDYLVSRATGYCKCNGGFIQTPLNACVEPKSLNRAAPVGTSTHIMIWMSFFICATHF